MTDAAPEEHVVSIPGVPDKLYERLRRQASRHNRSIEDEARLLLERGTTAIDEPMEENFADVIRRHFADSGGLGDLMIPDRKDPSKLKPITE
ncbi:FitA-like ribbon-helix-helix domain-containing protein [Glycomyces salinus]|uniref:FitA-like ribbon-helix-helix domain-containing protein n=1 Tax=Glycomyces salinus TaxID=980294 RepID=UPI0035564FDF